MLSESDIVEMLEEAKAPGNFKIVDVLKDRAFPTDEVSIFIDEDAAFMAAEVEAQINKMGDKMDGTVDSKELEEFTKRHEELVERLDKIKEEMGGTRYVFYLQGISEGVREDLFEKSVEKYPIQHEVDRNPLTGEVERREKESPKRDRLFTNLIWQAHIKKIVAPDGSVQEGITLEDAVELRRALPLASSGKITEAIEKLRTATALFMLSTDENFLAKS
jgi:hypothetical protein